MTDQLLVLRRLANRAVELETDADFREIIRCLKERTLFEWANTASDAADRREELYRDVQATSRLEHFLKELPQQYRAEIAKQEAESRRGRREQ